MGNVLIFNVLDSHAFFRFSAFYHKVVLDLRLTFAIPFTPFRMKERLIVVIANKQQETKCGSFNEH